MDGDNDALVRRIVGLKHDVASAFMYDFISEFRYEQFNKPVPADITRQFHEFIRSSSRT